VADPTNSVLRSAIAQGFKANDLKFVGATLIEEIKERANDVATVSGLIVTTSGTASSIGSGLTELSGEVATKASLSGDTFTGAVIINAPLTVSGDFTTFSGGVNFVLEDYADDAAADAGGIGIGQLYRNGSVVQIRVS
jgi:hypothetical protein